MASAALACLVLPACSSAVTAGHPVAAIIGTAPLVAPSTPDSIVERVAVQPADLPSTEQRQLMPAGDQVSGQVTLDNCGYGFTTEQYRVARREYNVVRGSAGQLHLANEVVAYDTAQHASQALAEWYASAAHCPHGPMQSSVASEPALTTTVLSNRRGAAGLPAHTNVVSDERVSAANEGSLYGSFLLQVHGTVLDAVYAESRTPVSPALEREAKRLAVLTGRRLLTVR